MDLKKALEYIPLFTICLLYFGLCNLYFFYREFQIDIVAYISTPDIILSFFPTIVWVTTILYGALITEFFKNLNRGNNPPAVSPNAPNNRAWLKKRIIPLAFSMLILAGGINIFLGSVFHI